MASRKPAQRDAIAIPAIAPAPRELCLEPWPTVLVFEKTGEVAVKVTTPADVAFKGTTPADVAVPVTGQSWHATSQCSSLT